MHVADQHETEHREHLFLNCLQNVLEPSEETASVVSLSRWCKQQMSPMADCHFIQTSSLLLVS